MASKALWRTVCETHDMIPWYNSNCCFRHARYAGSHHSKECPAWFHDNKHNNALLSTFSARLAYPRFSKPSFTNDERRCRLRIDRVGQMRRQDQVAMQADIIPNMADDQDLGAGDAANGFAIVWVAEDLIPSNSRQHHAGPTSMLVAD